jgi:muramoyltetrapeptide carboxypeptidase
VLAVRGGYGASRLLPHIDWQALVARQRQNPLLICGHSDFTAIQMGLLAKGSIITFSGPMLAGNFGAEAWTRLPNTISGRRCAARNLPSNGRAKAGLSGPGTLWGGNLAMITSLIGTPWLPQIATAFWCWKILTSIRSASNACCCSCSIAVSSRISAPLSSAALPAPA